MEAPADPHPAARRRRPRSARADRGGRRAAATKGDVRAPLPEPTQATRPSRCRPSIRRLPQDTAAAASTGSLELERALLVSNQRLGELQSNVEDCLQSAACAEESGGVLLRQLAEAAKRERAAIEEAFEHDGGDCLAPSIPKVLVSLDAMIEAGSAISFEDVDVALAQDPPRPASARPAWPRTARRSPASRAASWSPPPRRRTA